MLHKLKKADLGVKLKPFLKYNCFDVVYMPAEASYYLVWKQYLQPLLFQLEKHIAFRKKIFTIPYY